MGIVIAKKTLGNFTEKEMYAFPHCLLRILSFIHDVVVTNNWEF